MDIVDDCLSLTPVLCLEPAFSSLKFIRSYIKQAQVGRRQLEDLTQLIARLLRVLDGEYREGRLRETLTLTPLANLRRLLDNISAFVQRLASSPFLKLLFTEDQRNARIDGYYRSIVASIESFHISPLLDTHVVQTRNDDARAADQRELNDTLLQLENNPQRLMDKLNTHRSSITAMIVSLQRRIDQRSDGERERKFFSHVLRYLTTSSGLRVHLQNWMITSYEVEFGPKIGSGGFGQVFLGTWNNTQVALKVLTTDAGITPSSTAIRQEIDTWSMLRHTHILQFLGANEFDNKPFNVMPYMQNGNARDYVRNHPDRDRLQIFHHISLGLVYLHSHKIIHGDLKALNILIDASGRAVLCDFGLSRIKTDVTSRTMVMDNRGIVMGSRNWMAPEQLLGQSPKKPCDIYAFGMTVYEIFADEIPLGHMNYAELLELVVRQDVRPERPDDEDAPQLSDAVWELANKCWVKDPKHRPSASAVCDIISHLFIGTTRTPRRPLPSSQTMSELYSPNENNAPRPPTSPQSVSTFLHTASEAQSMPDTCLSSQTIQSHPRPLPPVPAQNSPPHPSIPPQNTSILLHTTLSDLPVPEASFSHPIVPPPTTPQSDAPAQARTPNPLTPPPNLTVQGTPSPLTPLANLTLDKHLEAYHIYCAAFSPNGKYIVSGFSDGTIIICDAQTGSRTLGPLREHTIRVYNPIYCVTFSAEGRRIALGSHDKTILVWDAVTGQMVAGPFKGHADTVSSVSFSPDGKQIVSGSWDNTIRVWDAQTGNLLVGPLTGHTSWVEIVTFSGDGNRIVSGSNDKTLRVWDAKSGRLMRELLTEHRKTVRFAAFSPGGKRIISASQVGDVCVWDTHTGALVSGPSKRHAEGTLTVVFTPNSTCYCAVSPDGKWIAAREHGNLNIVEVWDTKTGQLAATFSEHTGYVGSLSFSPDSKRVLTASNDQTVRVHSLISS